MAEPVFMARDNTIFDNEKEAIEHEEYLDMQILLEEYKSDCINAGLPPQIASQRKAGAVDYMTWYNNKVVRMPKARQKKTSD